MEIFYSAKHNTFFNEVFHGTRTIKVPEPGWVRPVVKIADPKWVRPTIAVPNPDWTRPFISVPNPDWSEGDDSVPRTILVPDEAASRPMIDVLDESVSAPLIEVPDEYASAPLIDVPNPACLLPPESELVVVPQDEHDEIYRALSLGGLVLEPGDNGGPITVPAPGPTLEELKSRERVLRDRALLLTDPPISRHRDQVEAGRPMTLTAEQYKELQGYRQDLRDWPESKYFPAIDYRPVQPAWLSELIQ